MMTWTMVPTGTITSNTFNGNMVYNIATTGSLKHETIEELGFIPTSTHKSWKGKYKCMYCKSTGWISPSYLNYQYWWGHRHGNNCRKRFV